MTYKFVKHSIKNKGQRTRFLLTSKNGAKNKREKIREFQIKEILNPSEGGETGHTYPVFIAFKSRDKL